MAICPNSGEQCNCVHQKRLGDAQRGIPPMPIFDDSEGRQVLRRARLIAVRMITPPATVPGCAQQTK